MTEEASASVIQEDPEVKQENQQELTGEVGEATQELAPEQNLDKPQKVPDEVITVVGEQKSDVPFDNERNEQETENTLIVTQNVEEDETVEETSSSESDAKDETEIIAELEWKPSTASTASTASFTYDLPGRITSERSVDEFSRGRHISGDFKRKSDLLRFSITMDMPVTEEGEPEVLRPIVIESTVIGLEKFIEQYNNLYQKFIFQRLRNSVLQLKVAENFRTRNMGSALIEHDYPISMYREYEEKLEEMAEFWRKSKTRQTLLTTELHNLSDLKKTKSEELEAQYNNFQHWVQKTGQGLIFSKSKKELPDKLVENYVRRQKSMMMQMAKIRQDYNLIRSRIASKQKEFSSVNIIDGDLSIGYYEELREKNRIWFDKIEETEMYLTNYRKKTRNIMEILNHYREKISAINSDICDIKQQANFFDERIFRMRQVLGTHRHERDRFRSNNHKLKEELGLSYYPELLRDMEASKVEVAALKEKLERIKNDYNIKGKQVKILRKKLEDIVNSRKKNIRNKITFRPPDKNGQKRDNAPLAKESNKYKYLQPHVKALSCTYGYAKFNK